MSGDSKQLCKEIGRLVGEWGVCGDEGKMLGFSVTVATPIGERVFGRRSRARMLTCRLRGEKAWKSWKRPSI